MKKEPSTIGKNIKKLRLERELSQEGLARDASVSLLTISKIESGTVKSPGVETAQKIARALGVSIDDLMK